MLLLDIPPLQLAASGFHSIIKLQFYFLHLIKARRLSLLELTGCWQLAHVEQ